MLILIVCLNISTFSNEPLSIFFLLEDVFTYWIKPTNYPEVKYAYTFTTIMQKSLKINCIDESAQNDLKLVGLSFPLS